MSALDPKKTYRNLKKKGFGDLTQKKDHKYLELRHNGKYILHTKISHGSKDLGSHLIKQMSVQCQLSKSEFMDLANCPLSQADFIKILKEKGLID